MQSLIHVFIIGLILNSCSGAYINPGKEYVYTFTSQVNAGSSDYQSFASAFNITGKIRIQKSDPTLVTAKLEDLAFGAYNGEYGFPTPQFSAKSYQQLNPLTEPFHVKLDSNNQFSSIVLSGAIPEWARNIHRGFASAFQLNADRAAGQETTYELVEKTIHGECPTVHQIVKTEDGVQIMKQRNNAKCQNRALYIRSPGTYSKNCVDDETRDVYNSTAYGQYVVSNFNGETTLTRVVSGGYLQYSIFGPKGHTQYSWTSTNAFLQEIKSSGFTKIPAPSNAQTFTDLKYVFESKFTADDSLDVPVAFYSHYAEAVTDEAVLKAASDRVYENIQKLADSLETVKVFEDTHAFHKTSPFSIIPDVALLHFSHLKTLYNRVKSDNKYTTTKLFLDTLVVAGTGPAAKLVQEIASSTTDTRTLANLIAPLPNYVHNPTEKLLAQFETLINPDLPKHNLRIIEFAFASLISRTCAMYDCKKGYVEKYAKYFSDKYDNGATFEDKSAAVHALQNLGRGDAIKKLVSIVKDKTADRSVRTAAMTGLKHATPEEAKAALLPIYYDKQAHHELRTKAALHFLNNFYDDAIAGQMVTFLWFDHCKYVRNFMYTLIEGLSNSKRSCLAGKVGIQASSVLTMFPPTKVDRTLSAHYTRDYYDREYNFGHMTQLSIQKNGDSVLPVTIYGTLNGAIAGYGTNYMSFFIRIEGLGKALADRIMSMTTGQISFDEVKSVFAKVGVTERTSTPLRIELALNLHGRCVAYHAADASTVTTIPVLLKKLQEMKSSYDIELSRLMLLGGIRAEQPSEFGTPVSVFSGVTALGNVQIKTSREKSGTSISQTSDWNLQGNFFGMSKVSNHFPAFGTQHSVIAIRTFRARLPRKFSFSLDYKALTLNINAETPTKEDPILAMIHATAGTKVFTDGRSQNIKEGEELLKTSCPNCQHWEVISKGAAHRGTRQIGLPEVSRFKIFEGVKRGAKYFDCEKPHTRYDTIKRLAKFINEDNKNAGKLAIVRLFLSLQYARDYLFLSPMTQTCGIKAYYHRDPEAKSIFEKVEATLRFKYTPEPNKKLGTKIQIKGALAFKHGGTEPHSRTVDVTGGLLFSGMEKRETKLRFSTKDESSQKQYVVCLEANTQMKKAVDFFNYEGEDEPTFERKITLKWGEEAGKDSCPENAAYIKAIRKSHRSQEQIEESKSNGFPYKQCNEQKGSAHWPGSNIPPTHECIQAAVDQTNLRESNITIEYQVNVEARNRWRKPAIALAALLLPYWDSERSTVAAHAHAHHVEPSSNSEYVKGSVEIDVSARKVNPTMDMHVHASFGEEHFHNVDLAVLPGPLKVKPVFSRFSPYFYEMFKLGVFGYCAASPQSVITFDNFTYHAGLPDCEVLLAGDCDDKPRYAVLANKIGGDKIGLTIHLGEHKLEMKDINSISVDGKAHPVSDTIYVDEDEEKLFKFVKINPTYVGIMSEKLSLYIGYSGQWVSVTAGSRYRATSCGLCGNFDNSPHNDFVGPDNNKVATAEDMMKAYTVQGGKC